MINLTNLLINLCKIEKVSGDESTISKFLQELLAPLCKEIIITQNNSVIAKFSNSKSNSKEVILTAHLDEIGFLVKEITENGFLKIENCGRTNLNLTDFQIVEVHGARKLTGFSFITNEAQNEQSKELLINLGLKKQEVEKVVKAGDRVNFKFNPIILNDNKFCSKSLDDSAGVASILLAINKINLLNLNCNLTVIFSSQEETSSNGIITSSNFCNADVAICVDVTFAKFLGCDVAGINEMTKGPAIGVSPILDLNLTKKLQKIAIENKITHQLEIMNEKTSTDADKIVKTNKGIKTCLISIPIKYMHSPIEQVALIDILNTSELIVKFIESIYNKG